MTHYQKIAMISIRIVGLVFMILGSIFCLLGFTSAYLVRDERQFIYLLMMNWCFVIFGIGISLFATSQLLAKLACFGLNKFDEK